MLNRRNEYNFHSLRDRIGKLKPPSKTCSTVKISKYSVMSKGLNVHHRVIIFFYVKFSVKRLAHFARAR